LHKSSASTTMGISCKQVCAMSDAKRKIVGTRSLHLGRGGPPRQLFTSALSFTNQCQWLRQVTISTDWLINPAAASSNVLLHTSLADHVASFYCEYEGYGFHMRSQCREFQVYALACSAVVVCSFLLYSTVIALKQQVKHVAVL